MNVGFIHGVMNTDNMTLSGETIDYGPCAFLEAYDPATVFSSIDRGGRYAYGNQPRIAQWNLARFAEALLPLVAPESERAVALATEVIDGFAEIFARERVAGQRRKLGLASENAGDAELADAWLALLAEQRVDLTLAWRRLADAAAGDPAALDALFEDRAPLAAWLARWRERCAAEGGSDTARAASMRRASPFVVPRNHRVEEALAAAVAHGDLAPFDRLLAALEQPFEERPEHARYAEPAPREVTAGYKTFCGT
jgi:uncharacterized protein YdiU (UPF0061 family)